MLAEHENLKEVLLGGIKSAKLDLSAEQVDKLLVYLEQLHKWNKAYNLSGVKNINDMLRLHILDSLVMAPFIDAHLIADVGTGAGLPGVPLAIMFPEKHFILIDGNSKKTRFIFQTAALLALKNLEVVHSRVEDYASHPQVDIVTSRAFASLADFVGGARHLLKADGKFLAMKGQLPSQEIEALGTDFRVEKATILQVPGVDAQRHVIDIRLQN